MKKRLIVGAMMLSLLGMSLTGCSTTKELSNEYITVTKYKGLEVDKVEITEVTDTDIESTIQNTLETNKIYNEVTDRVVEDGDTVTVDYIGKVDGEEFDGGSAEGQQLEIGSNLLVEGFESGILGHAAGETFDIDITFPEEYPNNPDLASKNATFTITINKIETTSLPEFDDEFVKTVSESSTTIDEYKEEVKKTLQENNTNTAETTLQDEVYTALLEHIEVTKYPESDLETATDSLRSNQEQTASYYGMELADYIEAMGMTEDQFEEQLTEQAQTTVKFQQAIELIAKKEKLTPTEKEYQKQYEQYAEDYGYENVDALIETASEETLQQMVKQEVVMNWLVDNCKQIEPTETKESTEEISNDSEDTAEETDNNSEAE